MFWFCSMGAEQGKLKSTERVFDEFSVEKNALRSYAATYGKLEDLQSSTSPWAPVFEGHALKSVYANAAELKVLVENTHDMQWISVSGTETPETALCSYELDTKNDFGLPMHTGILAVAVDIHDAVVPFLDKGKALRITGHSVGGAAATALAYRLAKAGYSIEQVVSFGAPKFTDAAGAKKIEKALDGAQLLRVTSADDAVTALPPPKLDVGWFVFSKYYTHAGGELHLSGGAPMTYSGADMPREAALGKAAEAAADQTWNNLTWLAQAESSRMAAYLSKMKPTTDVKVQFHQILAAVTK